ncbi:MAG TPA: hypothetical protein PLL10_02345, partial [Elusimicrobiales bacterium]|nr:hypothetical protein [Elusimicrobiales bacterium]
MREQILRKIHRTVLWYTLLSTPVVLTYVRWFSGPDEVSPQGLFHRGMNLMGGLWVVGGFYLVLALVFYKEFREGLLSRLAGFKERDEREQHATADAARSTFLLMLGVEIVFLLMSLSTFEIVKKPNGHGLLKVGAALGPEHADLFSPNPPAALQVSAMPEGTVSVVAHLLPPNTAGLLLLLIFVQL